MLNPIHRRLSILLLGVLAMASVRPVQAQIQFPPTLGVQNAENDVGATYIEVFAEEFEGDLPTAYAVGPNYTLTTAPAEVLAGKCSLKLEGAMSAIQIPASILNLEPEQLYLAEFRYRLIDPAANGNAFVVALTWPEFPIGAPDSTGGAFNQITPEEGVFHYTMRIGQTTEAVLTIANLDPAMIIDSLRIYRHEVQVRPAEPKPLSCGFPRLSNFHVYSSTFSGLTHGGSTEEFVSTLGLYDMVNGIPYGHTRGSDLEFLTLRGVNPDIILLPYVQSFMAVIGPTEPAGGSANLLAFFNQGLEEDWFMRGPDGEKLPEILYPDIFQMNHTEVGKEVDGVTFVDYMSHFLSQSVLGSGLWDGIHFDQAEWRTNTLLGDPDPFGGGESSPPEIDLDDDGIAETEEELVLAWRNAYYSYFDRMRIDLGPSKIFFGNPGRPPLDPTLLSRVNGFQFEFFNPFQIDSEGNFATANGSSWHRYHDMLQRCAAHMQAPQVFSTQFSGKGLGTPSGTITGNGVADREPVLESRDYHRMRVGLTTTLLGNGFFGYDFVDNTTEPTAWFDEYSVDENGVATKSLQAKGYLGQALDDAFELPSEREVLYFLDFEEGTPAPPLDFYVNPSLQTTSDPELVLSGEHSSAMTYVKGEGEVGTFLVSTLPQYVPLEMGEVYEISVDYRISDFNETTGNALSVGITDYAAAGEELPFQVSSLTAYDFRENLEGTLRAVATVNSPDASAGILVLNDLSVVIDNVRISKGAGGVFRRDFENGVVLVNPTAAAVSVPLAQLQGPFSRTGLRRILGTQDPAVNSGLPVTGDLTIPSGDGIILLADHVEATALAVPGNLQVENVTEDGLEVSFDHSGRPAAGFKVSYGITGGDRTSFMLRGMDHRARLIGLKPGANYEIGVCAFDFHGNFFPESALVTTTTSGPVPASRPAIDPSPTLVRGEEIQLLGTNLAGSSTTVEGTGLPETLGGLTVFINGLPCGLRSVSSSAVTLEVPSNLAPPVAVVRVERDGVSGPSFRMQVLNPDGGQVRILSIFLRPPNGIELLFASKPNEVYWVERTLDGFQSWERYRRVVATSNQTRVQLSKLGASPQQFFRVVRE